ncbi:spore coat-associated protein N [Salibacterium salarium]|uniref:TasA family protein n=1 Tax=Salibacterium salarium TaxID=284579 RepID=UPI0027800AC8|nr:TasA family protein [Salibacterium salarium]MDQ0297784.1 spore coat-associated protein N [Salibacterium salarium]
MGLKKKLGLGVSTAALGLSLIGGGTFAYFSDSAEANGTFSAGTLDLEAKPTTVIDLENIKPGDTFERPYKLKNNGSLDIAEIMMTTDYNVIDAENDNGSENFAEHIEVTFVWNDDKEHTSVYKETLDELKGMEPDVLGDEVLKAGDYDEMYVKFEFVDNGEDQNIFQGDAIEVEWTFEGMQGDGEEK